MTVSRSVCFVVPPRSPRSVVADFAGGLGFEQLDEFVLPPLDLLQLAAGAQSAGWIASVIDALAACLTVDDLLHALEQQAPSAVVISSTVPTLEEDLQLAEKVRAVVGTIHLRFRSKDPLELEVALRGGAVDSVLHGECDDNIGAILDGTDDAGTAHIAGDRVVVIDKALLPNLDELPHPARSLSDPSRYAFPKLGVATTMLTSRGCPYSCGYYCPYPMVQGRKWRARSVGSVVDELKSLRPLGIDAVLFRDPVFTLDLDRARGLCEQMAAEALGIRWWCETRADRLDEPLIHAMATAGCVGINVGVESGDPELRFSVLKRGVTDDVLEDVCRWAHAVDVEVAFLMMVGFPGETRLSVFRSAELIWRCRPDHVGIGFPVNHPGTRFHDDAVRSGWITMDGREHATGAVPVVVAGLSSRDMTHGRAQLLSLHHALKHDDRTGAMSVLTHLERWSQST